MVKTTKKAAKSKKKEKKVKETKKEKGKVKVSEQKKISKKDVELVEKLTKELIKKLGVDAGVDVLKDEENNAVQIKIDAKDETGLLIGNRGATIVSLQSAIGMMVRQETGEWVRIIVDIADWREKQEERLKKLADQTVERALQTNEPQPLYNLSSSERRTIHIYLSESKDVTTESLGEGNERYLLVKPK